MELALQGAAGDSARSRAAITIGAAVAAGVATQALFWRAGVGLSWTVLVAMLVVGTLLAFGSRENDRARPWTASAVVAAAALVLGGAVAWRASDWAVYVAVPASAALLVVLPFVVAGKLRVADLGALPRVLFDDGVRRVPAAVVATVDVPRRALDATGRAHAVRLVKGLAIGLPVTCIFVALLAADPNFRRALARSAGALDSGAHFGALAAITSVAYLFAYALHTRARRPIEREDGAPASPMPYRRPGDLDAPAPARGAILRPLTWSVVLAQLVAVFGVFVAANARYLFGGHALVTAKGTPTYAGYLHAGFAQLTLATVLAVVVVVVGHKLVASAAPMPRAWRVALSALEATLLTLTAITLASCAQRLRIYDEAYGYTYLRLGVAIFQLGVLAVLALTLVKAIAPSWRGYAASIALAGIGVAVFAGTFDADGFIARANVARANAGRPLDLGYLESLNADCAPVLGDAYFARDPDAKRELSSAWYAQRASKRHGDWRSWRALAW